MRNVKKKRVAAAVALTALASVGVGSAAQAGDWGGGSGSYSGGSYGGYDQDGSCTNGSTDGSNRRSSLQVLGLTSDNRLVCFNEFRPGDARTVGRVTGLSGDTRLVGVDFRPATGELIGLGNAGGVYSISPTTAAATKKSQLNVALTGADFGVDFNPTVDRLRIVSNTGQNLRANVDTGATVVDGTLNYMPGATATGVTGAGYTNNDADANTATTLYDVDSMMDQVAIQAPPNAGTLNPTGKLGVDTGPAVGFDIYSTIRSGTTVNVMALASLSTSGTQTTLSSVALFSGRAQSRGAFSTSNRVVDIAIPLNQL